MPRADRAQARCLGARAFLEQGRPRAAAARLAELADGPLPAEVAAEVALLEGWVAATVPGRTVAPTALLEGPATARHAGGPPG